MDTSVPRQRDASDAALVDMLMLEAPVGLALFGPDLRFRWVNAALMRLGGLAGQDPSTPLSPSAPLGPPDPPDPSSPSGPSDPSGPPGPPGTLDFHGRLPSQTWPEDVAA